MTMQELQRAKDECFERRWDDLRLADRIDAAMRKLEFASFLALIEKARK
jgi:hypothetical protein